jgi:hypothetical protein
VSAVALTLAASSAAVADESTVKAGKPLTSTSAPVTATAPNAAAPASTTTVTSADEASATATPMPTAQQRPADRETITLYSSVHPNKPFLITGGIMFIGAYATTATLTAVSNNANVDKNLYLPIVGPWVHLGSPSATASNKTMDTVLVAGSGVVQGVGAGLMVLSLFVPEKVPAATIQAGNTKVHIMPASFGVGSAGVGAGGTF